MALNFFRRGNKPEDKKQNPSADTPAEPGLARDPRKAKRFFEHAQTNADTRNYEYAIQLFIDGLRHDPDNMAQHEALRDVALKYKVGGGKTAGLSEKFKSQGKDPVSKMLDAERIWSKDPLNMSLMLDMMEKAVEAAEAEPELHLGEVAYWVGTLVLEFGRKSRKTPDKVFIKSRDLFARIGSFDKAVEACRLALSLRPDDAKLLDDLKDLETEMTLKQGAYAEAGKEGGFKSFVKDMDKQRALEQEQAVDRTESVLDEVIARYRKEYEANQDVDLLEKLVGALLQKGDDASEAEAMTRLKEAWERTEQYRFKVRHGDIAIRQINRKIRVLRQAAKDNPQDAEAAAKLRDLSVKLLKFELQEYTERAKNYPTDLALKFQLGRRLMQFQKFDEAIAALQDARGDAKVRVQSLLYLGMCYAAKGWPEEATDTLREGISIHPIEDDAVGMDLRYQLMDALEKSARKNKQLEQAREAQKIASKILQTDIKYRDIKDRLDAIRKLVDELSAAQNP
ncbi:MAG: hypothetical protein IT443_04310 [Phycisphaeraceae bacterium]|nr:hypothetical protein [Phycisphaeraceae bacterium]